MKQNAVARERNRARRSSVKTEVRKFLDAVHDNDVTKAAEAYRDTTKLLDQTVAKGTFHKNTVARKKSRLALRLNAMKKAGK